MRRLTLAAVVGTLVLSACNDQRQSPTEPPVLFSKAKCQAPAFPHTTVVAEIKNVFPPGLRGREVSQSAHIKNDWDACRAGAAQQGVVNFINGMNADFAANRLVGTAAQRNQLITTLLTAVGLASPPSFELGPDFGVGLYDPNKLTAQVFETAGGTALTELLHGAFSEFTIIVISRRPDGSNPLDFEGEQFPPFFDYNALNASGNHFFEQDGTATIAFCQLPQTEGFQYPPFEDIKIGHNAPAKLTPPTRPAQFELLDPEVVPEGLATLLNCGNLGQTALGNFGGLESLARATGRYLAPIARALFMPAPLQAATTAVGYVGPIATKPGSFSPFGIVKSGGSDLISPLSCSLEGGEGGIRSQNSDTPVDLTFTNNTSQSVSVYWLNFYGFRQYPFVIEGDGIGVPYRVLAPGESYVQATFLTHPWILIGADETCYGIFVPTAEGGRTVVVP